MNYKNLCMISRLKTIHISVSTHVLQVVVYSVIAVVLFWCFETGSLYVAKIDLKLEIFLPQLP
jgi:hypothetical protein